MRKLINITIMLLMAVFVVNALGNLNITTENQKFEKNSGTSFSFDIQMENLGNETLKNVTLSKQSGDFGEIVLTFPQNSFDIGSTPVTQSINVNIPSTTSAGTYTGIILAETEDKAHSDTLTLEIVVKSTPSLTTSSTPLTLKGNAGELTDTKTFKVKNSGNTNINNIKLTYDQKEFTDKRNNIILLNFSETEFSLAKGQEKTITVNGNIEEGMYLDTYSGLISVSDGTTKTSFTMSVGVTSDILDINLKDINPEPANPGDDVDIEIEFINLKDEKLEDLEVTVKILDIDKGEDIEYEMTKFDLKDDETETITLTIPLNVDEDSFDIIVDVDGELQDSGTTFRVVELFKDTLEVEKEDDDRIQFDGFSINPSTISCGDTILVEATAVNTGSSSQKDMYIELSLSSLSITRSSTSFDLDADDEDEREEDVSFTITIPEDAEEGIIELKLFAKDEDGDFLGSKTETLTIENGCSNTEPEQKESDVEVTLDKSSLEAEPKDSITIPIEITNNADQDTFTISVSGYNSFATLAGIDQPTEDLSNGEKSTGFINLLIDEDANQGSNTITITVKNSAGEEVAKEVVVINIKGESDSIKGVPPTGFAGIFSNLSNNNWTTTLIILGDILLVLVIIYFIKLIAKKR